eukprot:TRINITY_DN8501_c0_g1_i1.p1 TRINITY_DN8501_c0_g1~~TRINITY_DN8501_c0_g1_i1.p1  ORF type:complete len:320 (+),score=84.74 TRINITY_DN8501_c0_g1_i1:34-993(+)
MDSDSETITSSEEEEVVEVVDFAKEAAKRLEEDREWQKTGAVKERKQEKPTQKQKRDPYAMLPKRYKHTEVMPKAAPKKVREVTEDKTLAVVEAAPVPEVVVDENLQVSDLPPPTMEPEPDYLGDFDPSVLANLLEKENDERVYHPHMDDDEKFDLAQSVLEEMLEADPRFWQIQIDFKDKHCNIFEDAEENKLQYTSVHQEWVAIMDSYITKKLTHTIKNFSVSDFMEILEVRSDEVSGEVWSFLLSFTDFQTFKTTMLNHKLGFDEETDFVLSKGEVNRIINDAQSIMDGHFVTAIKQKEALLAQQAVESGMENLDI